MTTLTECLPTLLATVGLISCVMSRDYVDRMSSHTPCNCRAYLLCEFSCVMSRDYVDRMSYYTPRNCITSLLCEFSCKLSASYFEIRHSLAPCDCVVYEFSCVVSDCHVEGKFSHTPCTCMVSCLQLNQELKRCLHTPSTFWLFLSSPSPFFQICSQLNSCARCQDVCVSLVLEWIPKLVGNTQE